MIVKKPLKLQENLCAIDGMIQKLGPRKYGKESNQVFLGRDYSNHSKHIEKKQGAFDQNIGGSFY